MSETIKRYPKKLRGKEVLMVDNQLARWRKKLEKAGLVVGKHRAKQIKTQDERYAGDKEKAAIECGKLNFFGVEEE